MSPATDQSDAAIEVALFPIPNAVAFPGTIMPLHVFEPRYRQMIQDCVRDDRMIAVTDVLKTIHKPSAKQSLEEALSTNQATYKPRDVFSAGHCKIIETTPDGRIIATITMSHRLKLIEELQSLPYRIVSCNPLTDTDEPATTSANAALAQAINNRLKNLVGNERPELLDALNDPEWTSLDPGDFSFQLFQFLRFDAPVMQKILETRSASERLAVILNILEQS